MWPFNKEPEKNLNLDIKEGDYITSDLPSLREYFKHGSQKVIGVRKVDWSKQSYDEGNAIKIDYLDGIELWSKYLTKV